MTPVPKDFPLVTYNIWGTEDKGVEETILAEIPLAADLGVDVLYLDAGWYEGSAKDGSGDWMTGVGNYAKEDRVKFPHGLAEMSRKVHAAGMKFGLWFAPRVVDSRLVGTVIPPDFVAKHDGQNIALHYSYWTPITQICPGDPKVVEHLKKMIGDAVERYNLDWVKYDNSGVTNVCNRTDHGHQATDGALAALQGQYEIWKYLHQRFPKLMMEDCDVDYGLARMATSHWASGDPNSAEGVRRSEIDASYVFPAAHFGAFVLGNEGAKDPAVLDAVIRSRMIVGTWTFATYMGRLSERVSLFPANLKAAWKRNIRIFKQYRHLLREDVYHLLPSSTKPQEWDAIEFCKRDGSEAVVLAFRSQSPEAEKVLPLRGLMADASYDVKDYDSSQLRVLTGKELAAAMKVSLPVANSSSIIHLKKRPN
jgi:alpha-galactosidase